jgi:hypothetical protein
MEEKASAAIAADVEEFTTRLRKRPAARRR